MAQYSLTTVTTTTTSITHARPLAADELAHAVGAGLDWVVELVEVGIVELPSPRPAQGDWRFHSADLQCALEARRLQRDFGVSLDAAGLILDLQHEVRRLKAMLGAQGLGRDI